MEATAAHKVLLVALARRFECPLTRSGSARSSTLAAAAADAPSITDADGGPQHMLG